MSDMDVVEIEVRPHPTELSGTSGPAELEVKAKKEPKPEKPQSGWQKTRRCFCPTTAFTDCRFHSVTEPGWETCPWTDKPGRTSGRWLWSSMGAANVSDADLSIGANLKELSKSQQTAGDKILK